MIIATTHWSAYDELASFGAHPTEQTRNRLRLRGAVQSAAADLRHGRCGPRLGCDPRACHLVEAEDLHGRRLPL